MTDACAVHVDASRDGRQVVIRLSGEFDVEAELDLELVFETASAARSVEVHVADVRFADSTLLNLLLRMVDRFDVRLVGPLPSQLARIMRLTGVLGLFCIRGREGEEPV
ncbi:STAS domain-containing protein [Streptomyces sp. NPDC005573]|uniref:STAS domain-containing protein n=1 Tax=unclassified Streptomyces TaxID=2593676 RepID=UPI0033A712D9